jgi:hypothetical protein
VKGGWGGARHPEPLVIISAPLRASTMCGDEGVKSFVPGGRAGVSGV